MELLICEGRAVVEAIATSYAPSDRAAMEQKEGAGAVPLPAPQLRDVELDGIGVTRQNRGLPPT